MSRVAGVGDRGVCVTRQKLYHVEQFGGVWWIRGDGDVILEIHKEKWAVMGAAYRLALRRGPGRVNAVFFDPGRSTITNPVERAVVAKALEVVNVREFERREQRRRGFPS